MGKGAEADRVAIVEANGMDDGNNRQELWLHGPSLQVEDPDKSMAAAAEVVLAIDAAAGGRG